MASVRRHLVLNSVRFCVQFVENAFAEAWAEVTGQRRAKRRRDFHLGGAYMELDRHGAAGQQCRKADADRCH
jgi:hypothetical protein